MHGIVEQFETGLESMENWQWIILHLYIRLQIENFTNNVDVKEDDLFSNSFLVMLVVLKYFSEKKQNFLKEDHGKQWEMENFHLFDDHLVYWSHLLKFLKPRLFTSSEEEVYFNFVSDLFDSCSKVFVECIYNFCDLIPVNDKDLVTSKARTILTKAVKHTAHWNHFISLLKEDYNEVKNMDDFEIISNEKSRNYGTTVHVVKFKILSTLGYTWDHVHIGSFELYNLLLYFKDLYIENMNRNDTNCYHIALKQVTMALSPAIVSLNLDILIIEPTNDFLDLISFTFKIWKEYLFSDQLLKRSMINNTLSLYFKKVRKCTDDLLQAIIEAYEINRSNFLIYSELLKSVGNCFESIDQMSKIRLESFQQVINNAFETFVKNSDTERFSNEENLVEEGLKKSTLDTKNSTACLSMINELYFIISENNQFEQILSVMKHKCEDLFENYDSEENERLIFSFVSIISEILERTKRSAVLIVLDKLNYYPFLTRLIRFIFSKNIIDYTEEIISDIGPLPILIGQLCNTGIIYNCPYDYNQDEKEKDFLYDFVLPKIIDIVILPNWFIANAKAHIEENVPGFISIVFSCWALGRILHNDIMLNGGERSLSILDIRLGKMLKILELIHLTDNTEPISAYVDKMLSTIMFFIRKRMNIAPQIMKYRTAIYLLCSLEAIQKEEKMQLCYCVFEFVEFMFDNGYLHVTGNEIDWIEDLDDYKENYPLSLRIHSQRIIQKIIMEMDSVVVGEDEEEEEEE